MFRMKSVVGAVTLATIVATSAFAADTGALAPGKPAGVKNAQVSTGFLIIGAASVAVIAAVAITVSNQSGDKTGAPTQFPAATTTAG
jgi:hypothetical protein